MKALKCFLIGCTIVLINYGFANAQNNVEDCHAKAIRSALEAGGMNTKGYPLLSKNYGPFLSKLGFSLITARSYFPMSGDVRVFQPYAGGDPIGHVDMFDRSQWVFRLQGS